jgi:hypothetical protein
MRLKPKATVRMRAPAEPPTVGEWLAEQAARRRSALAQGRPIKVSALTLISPGRRNIRADADTNVLTRQAAAEESAP